MSQHRARKRFGQNFLVDHHILHKIIAAIAPQPADHLVEIGPGKGALTEYLAPLVKQLDVIEIDRDLVELLCNHFKNSPQIQIHQGDILNFNFKLIEKKSHQLRVLGNLPYNISTPLLFKLFEQIHLIKDMYFMLQKEVALRITAEVGSSHYSRLSVMSQYYCNNELLFSVAPGSFQPVPKVDSAVIRLQPKPDSAMTAKDVANLHDIVKEAFTYRRKTLHNALKQHISSSQLSELNINPQLRPQDISVAEYIKISNYLVDA